MLVERSSIGIVPATVCLLIDVARDKEFVGQPDNLQDHVVARATTKPYTVFRHTRRSGPLGVEWCA